MTFLSDASDPRIWVPKQLGWGWTLNFAHKRSWVTLAALLTAVGGGLIALKSL